MSFFQDVVYHLTIKPRLHRLKRIFPKAEIFPTGSRYVCDPPVLITDVDFIVYTEKQILSELSRFGFKKSDAAEYMCSGEGDKFNSFRKGVVNLIVTNDIVFANGYLMATHICKKHNVYCKDDRITVHKIVRDTTELDSVVESAEVNKLLENFKGQYKEILKKAYALRYNIGVGKNSNEQSRPS